MKILILSATQQEIQPFLQSTPKVDVLISGVGIASTIYHLTKQLHHHHYDLVIQAGIAGSFEKAAIELGEVVIVKQDCFGDMGIMAQRHFQSIQDIGFCNEPEWIINNNIIFNKLIYKQVRAVTVNTVTDNNIIINILQQKWNADIESMEGAALHYVCHHQQINYIQLRSISNIVGIRDKNQWCVEKAIHHLNEALIKTITQISF